MLVRIQYQFDRDGEWSATEKILDSVVVQAGLQTLNYEERSISRNRAQTALKEDGSFEMVVAHKDPGRPNWLDTEGRPYGILFWRFQLAEEAIEPLRTEVIELS